MFRGLFLRYLEKVFAAGELNFFSAHRHLHEPAAFRRYLTPAWKAEWALCRELLGMVPAEAATDRPADYRDRFEALTGQSLRECPHCHTGTMVVIDCIARPKVCQPVPDTS
jgi:hypothetical protein